MGRGGVELKGCCFLVMDLECFGGGANSFRHHRWGRRRLDGGGRMDGFFGFGQRYSISDAGVASSFALSNEEPVLWYPEPSELDIF